MIKLNYNGVTFYEETHAYITENFETLDGITGMIKKHLFPDMYKDVPSDVLKAKAQWGTERHKEMEQYVNSVLAGNSPEIKDDICVSFMSDITAENCPIRDSYFVRTEYTVTDKKKHATNIDLVLEVGYNKVVLIDYKTYADFNNNSKASVRWQLSIEKYMFELCNPGIEVVGAYAYLYTKKGEHYFWDVETFVPTEECIELIKCEDEGTMYIAKNVYMPNVITELPQNDVEKIALFLQLQAKVEELKKELDKNMLAMLEEQRANKIEQEHFTVSYVAPTKRKGIDTKALQTKYPEIYKEFLKESNVKASVRFKLK